MPAVIRKDPDLEQLLRWLVLEPRLEFTLGVDVDALDESTIRAKLLLFEHNSYRRIQRFL
jgi:hypothetical protein